VCCAACEYESVEKPWLGDECFFQMMVFTERDSGQSAMPSSRTILVVQLAGGSNSLSSKSRIKLAV
jgi:hypothetical protein